MEQLSLSNILMDSLKEKMFTLMNDISRIQSEFDSVGQRWEFLVGLKSENERLLRELHHQKTTRKKLENSLGATYISKIGSCCVCQKEQALYAPSNCGHLCLCEDCRDILENRNKCPICRGPLDPCIKIYLQ